VSSTEATPPAPPQSPLAALDATPVLARQTLIYAISGAIAPAVGLITLPILARVFSPSEYGLLELAVTLSAVALTLTDLSLTAAAQRSYFDYSDEEREARRRVLSTALLVSTALTTLVTLALILFSDPLSEFLFQTSEGRLVALVAATLVPLNTFRFVTEAMRLRFQALNYLVTTAIATIVGSSLAVVFLVGLDYGVESIFVAALIANGLAAIYGLAIVRDTLSGGFSAPDLRTMLAYGLPLVPTTLLLWALALIDRLILARLADLEAVGQYAIALRLTSILLLAVNAFHLALGPFLFSLYSSNPEVEKAARGRTFTYLGFVLGSAGLLLSLFAKEALAVIAPAFEDAYTAVGPLAFGTVAYGLASLLAIGISLARRTITLLPISVVSATVNVGLSIALIPPFGFVGAAFGTAVGYVVLATGSYWVGQRVYTTPYKPGRVLLILGAAAVLSIGGVVPIDSLPVALAVKVGLVGVFIVIVWASGAMTRSEFTELARFVRGMMPRGSRSDAPA
jgi:O-antigen/teichoic acid export membrane protein